MNVIALNDGELIAAFAEGGANEPFAELIRRHGAMVFRTCRRVSGSHQNAEDAMQLVFAALAEKAPQLAKYRSLGGWLYSTAWRVSRHVHRSQIAHHRRERSASRPAVVNPAMPQDDELLCELYRALEMLPPDYRDVVVLHHLEGLTVSQIAGVMNCSEGTTASRLSRGRAMVRERLYERGVTLYVSALEAILVAELMRPGTVPAPSTPQLPARELADAAIPIVKSKVAAATWMTGRRAVAACVSLLAMGAAPATYRQVAAMVCAPRPAFRSTASATVIARVESAGNDEQKAPEGAIADAVIAVPEPSTLSLFAAVGVGACLRRRRKLAVAR